METCDACGEQYLARERSRHLKRWCPARRGRLSSTQTREPSAATCTAHELRTSASDGKWDPDADGADANASSRSSGLPRRHAAQQAIRRFKQVFYTPFMNYVALKVRQLPKARHSVSIRN